MTTNTAPVPTNETERLTALRRYQILDTPPDGAFDRIVSLAAQILDVPIALVSLVDHDRIWFKARHGLDAQQIDRDPGLCASVILRDEAYVVNDARIDPRTLANPLVVGELGLRFYAAAPLHTHDGYNLGTLCVIDKQPRQLTEQQKQILADLAATVMDEMELRLVARRVAETDEALRRLNKQLEEANRHKSEFLANMSHEVRTPLNAILGASELLGDELFGPLNEKQAEYIRDINECGAHLLSLINDVLDLSRVEAGRLDLDPSDFALSSLMTSCATIVRERAASKSLDFQVKTPTEEVVLYADERKLKQIVYNLLSNAVKFTPEKRSVVFRTERDGSNITFVVEDTGPGVAEEWRERIFGEFFQVPGTQEGTGLGLAVSKQLVELHGGRIWLESNGDQGSRFTFTIPIEQPRPPLHT